MSSETDLAEKLEVLTHIATTLNRAVDVRSVLDHALADLVRLMNLETGWIFVRDPAAQDRRWGSGYVLAAHHNLPPALELDRGEAWDGGCECQRQCTEACLTTAYNQVRCSRLDGVSGDRRGLVVHASTPLHSGDHVLGILNVAGPDWASFSSQALTILANVGSQMGVALERARLFDLLQAQRGQEQAALLEFSNQLLARLDLDELMAYLVTEVRHMLHADACALLLPGETEASLDFRAASGWQQDPVAAGRQMPAGEQSGPGWTMHNQRPLLAEDIRQHDPLPWLPAWLAGEGFCGHAVMPLLVDGRAVGALAIDTRQPRCFDEQEIRLMRLMANQAAVAIEKARLHRQEIEKQRLEQDLELGREIQLGLLPRALPVLPGWDLAVYYQPARQVGGDFYDLFDLPGQPGRLGLVVADVAGKGVPAALFMALSRTAIRSAARPVSPTGNSAARNGAQPGDSPAAALIRANELIVQNSHAELFVTACYATLDTASGRLVVANAGHTRPLWLDAATGEFLEINTRGIVLGSFTHIDLDESRIDLAPGDLLVLYTDGVTEAVDAARRPFDQERLQSAVAARAGDCAQDIVQAIVEAVVAFTGNVPQADDCTVLVVKRCPEAGSGIRNP